jgi:hypothetical protein
MYKNKLIKQIITTLKYTVSYNLPAKCFLGTKKCILKSKKPLGSGFLKIG